MTTFRLLSADGKTNIEITTDLIGFADGSENLTVCQIQNQSTESPITAAGQKALNTFTREKHSVSELKAYAVAEGLTLEATEQGHNQAKVVVNGIVLAVPAGFSVTVNSATQITANWTKTPGATGYVLDRATNAGFTTGLVSTTLGDVALRVVTGLTTATHYYFRIRATAPFATTSAYATDDDTTA